MQAPASAPNSRRSGANDCARTDSGAETAASWQPNPLAPDGLQHPKAESRRPGSAETTRALSSSAAGVEFPLETPQAREGVITSKVHFASTKARRRDQRPWRLEPRPSGAGCEGAVGCWSEKRPSPAASGVPDGVVQAVCQTACMCPPLGRAQALATNLTLGRAGSSWASSTPAVPRSRVPG